MELLDLFGNLLLARREAAVLFGKRSILPVRLTPRGIDSIDDPLEARIEESQERPQKPARDGPQNWSPIERTIL